MKKENQAQIYQLIEKAGEPTERFSVCAEAQRILAKPPEEDRLNDFIWFIETAEAKWFSENTDNDAQDILKMLQGSDVPKPEQGSLFPMEEFSETQLRDYARKYDRLVSGFVDVFSIEGRTREDFYRCVLTAFDTFPPLREDDLAWSYCLFSLILDGRIPYYQIEPGLQMDQQDYSKLLEGMEEPIKKIEFIKNLRHSQKTERASQILYLLDELPTVEQKAILLGSLIVPPSEGE